MSEGELRHIDVDRGIERGPSATGPLAVDLPINRSEQESMDREIVVVASRQRTARGGRHVCHRPCTPRIESRLAHGANKGRPAVDRFRSPATPPGMSRYSFPRWRSDTPVIPTRGRKVASASPTTSFIPGSSSKRHSSKPGLMTCATLPPRMRLSSIPDDARAVDDPQGSVSRQAKERP